MNIADEIVELGEISHCGFALIEYATCLPGNEFIKLINKNGRWVCDPNFVTFQIHHKRANNIRISLRGNPEEFEQQNEMPLKNGMGGYSECSFESAAQMYAAISYIRRAWQIFQKGRSRTPKQPITIEK